MNQNHMHFETFRTERPTKSNGVIIKIFKRQDQLERQGKTAHQHLRYINFKPPGLAENKFYSPIEQSINFLRR